MILKSHGGDSHSKSLLIVLSESSSSIGDLSVFGKTRRRQVVDVLEGLKAVWRLSKSIHSESVFFLLRYRISKENLSPTISVESLVDSWSDSSSLSEHESDPRFWWRFRTL